MSHTATALRQELQAQNTELLAVHAGLAAEPPVYLGADA